MRLHHTTTIVPGGSALGSRAPSSGASSPTSAASLSEIDGALFMVNLDDAAPEGVHDTCLSMLMGNGTDRWFDKSFQLVVTANGKAALNFEHAWGDGVSVLRYCDEVHAAAADLPVVGDAELSALRSTAVPAAEAPEELSFEVPPEVADGIQRQRAAFDTTLNRSRPLPRSGFRAVQTTPTPRNAAFTI